MDVDNHIKKHGSLLVTKQQHIEKQHNTLINNKKTLKKTKNTHLGGKPSFFLEEKFRCAYI